MSQNSGGRSSSMMTIGQHRGVSKVVEEALNELKNANGLEERKAAARTLREALEGELREADGSSSGGVGGGIGPSAGAGTYLMHNVSNILLGSNFLNSADLNERLAGIAALDELIDLKEEPFDKKVIRSSNGFRGVLGKVWDIETARQASKALGHLKRLGGVLTSRCTEDELLRALERLRDTKGTGSVASSTRAAAVMVLHELAESAPSLVNTKRNELVLTIWNAACDPKPEVREEAVKGFEAFLKVATNTASAVDSISKQILSYLQSPRSTNEQVHGALLALVACLRNPFASDYLRPRFSELCEVTLSFRSSGNRHVRIAVACVISLLADEEPRLFAEKFLDGTFRFLVGLAQSDERNAAFEAIGEIVLAVGGDAFAPFLDDAFDLIYDALAPVKNGIKRQPARSPAVFACVGTLARAIGTTNPSFSKGVRRLMNPLFDGDLSPSLVDALGDIARNVPSLNSCIQERLLDSAYEVLIPKTVTDPVELVPKNKTADMEGKGLSNRHSTESIVLALNAVARLDFSGMDPTVLTAFVRECVVIYMDWSIPHVRRQATIACSRLVACAAIGSSDRLRRDVASLLSKMLMITVADLDMYIRLVAMEGLDDVRFDTYLAQPASLRELFLCFYDEKVEVKEKAVILAGRLCSRNPAQSLPALRKFLVRLMITLRCEGEALRVKRSDAAKLLSLLIVHAPRLVQPYVRPILGVLIARLRDSRNSADTDAATPLLSAIADFAKSGKTDLTPYLSELLPLVVSSLQVQSAGVEFRKAALRAFSRLVQNTGCVVDPYRRYPTLLSSLLSSLRFEVDVSVRLEVEALLGTVGAINPGDFKNAALPSLVGFSEISATESGGSVKYIGIKENERGVWENTPHQITSMTVNAAGQPIADVGGEERHRLSSSSQEGSLVVQKVETEIKWMEDDLQTESLVAKLNHPFTASADFFPSAALDALHRILANPRLAIHHAGAVQAVVSILESLKSKCVNFLYVCFPRLLWLLRPNQKTYDVTFKEYVSKRLGSVIEVAKQHMRHYVGDILALIRCYWDKPELLKSMLVLIEKLCGALGDEFRPLVPELLPPMLGVFHTDKTANRDATEHVLHTLEKFGSQLDDHVVLVLPAMLTVAENPSVPIHVRQTTLEVMSRLMSCLPVADIASCLILPLTRIASIKLARKVSITAQQVLVKVGMQAREDFALFAQTISKAINESGNVKAPALDELLVNAMGFTPKGPGVRPPSASLVTTQVEERPTDHATGTSSSGLTLRVTPRTLRKAWEVGRRSSRGEWDDWMQKLAAALFRESGSPAIRSCASLALLYAPLAHELFNPAFLSCWKEISSTTQAGLVGALETALLSETLPLDYLQTLLGLAEFMEHDEKPLPIDFSQLAAMACRCGAYAKALHYKEAEYVQNPAHAIAGDDGLISIYDNLGQRESAVGVLVDAERRFGVRRREDWFEKLQRWDEALASYESKQVGSLDDESGTRLSEWERKRGRIRCLNELGEWRRMDAYCVQAWKESEGDDELRQQLAIEGASSVALILGRWDEFAERVAYIQPDVFLGSFYRAILAVHASKFDRAKNLLDKTRSILDTGLTARVGEGYKRAYLEVLNAQLLVELEECIEYLMDPSPGAKRKLATMWHARLNGCRSDHRTWYRTLMVRGLVLSPQENMTEWLKFASLCRKAGRLPMASEAIRALLPPGSSGTGSHIRDDNYIPDRVELCNPDVIMHETDINVQFAFLKHMWAASRKVEAYELLLQKATTEQITPETNHLYARFYLTLSKWSRKLREDASAENGVFLSSEITPSAALEHSRRATELSPSWYKAWHAWALVNNETASSTEAALMEGKVDAGHRLSRQSTLLVKPYVVNAVTGFFKAITLGGDLRGTRLQDVLRLLTLWFRYGGLPEVHQALNAGFAATEADLWLDVVPQMIARLHTPVREVRVGLKELLVRIGQSHPQALVYALTVAAKSSNKVRRDAANEILNMIRLHSSALVEQAELVSRELIRVAILWHEMWHEGLEEASRLYFGEKNIEGMLDVLEPLHAIMEAGPETQREMAFDREFGRDLAEAWDWCRRYRASQREMELNQAWDLYYHVFLRINKQLPQLTTLDLAQVSPRLLRAKNFELAVPGTYKAKEGPGSDGLVTIQGFAPTLMVISSKQRPRKLVMNGSDGKEHAFLLKGHEDLRQDERVMQLLGLVNELLAQSKVTASGDLAIKRYAVVPLSPNSGLIGWVANCDTLHSLVRDFREQRKILLNVEHRLILQMAPDYDNLPRLNKVEVFEYALQNTTGADIAKVLWLKSRNAEIWLDRRTNFIRSLATMSMVGYILGLGDRHPSNLMLERSTGKILHIDFGDCFEVAMHREKYPEKVPFRLTRMLVNALEVCGVEGFFRQTCEAVMTVLRNDKTSLMAMLEAFVHDPLINWRLLGYAGQDQSERPKGAVTGSVAIATNEAMRGVTTDSVATSLAHAGLGAGGVSLTDIARRQNQMEEQEQRQSLRPRQLNQNRADGEDETVPPSLSTTLRRGIQRQVDPEGVTTTEIEYQEAVNQRAVAAIQRVSNKLKGRDFDSSEVLDVPAQVDRLIRQATAVERLCCLYVG